MMDRAGVCAVFLKVSVNDGWDLLTNGQNQAPKVTTDPSMLLPAYAWSWPTTCLMAVLFTGTTGSGRQGYSQGHLTEKTQGPYGRRWLSLVISEIPKLSTLPIHRNFKHPKNVYRYISPWLVTMEIIQRGKTEPQSDTCLILMTYEAWTVCWPCKSLAILHSFFFQYHIFKYRFPQPLCTHPWSARRHICHVNVPRTRRASQDGHSEIDSLVTSLSLSNGPFHVFLSHLSWSDRDDLCGIWSPTNGGISGLPDLPPPEHHTK